MQAIHPYARFLLLALFAAAACAQPRSPVSPPDYNEPTEELPRSGVPGLRELIRGIQDATYKYRDEMVAREDGYTPVPSSCRLTGSGSIGERYVNSSLVGLVAGSQPVTGTDTVIDLFRPEVLLYEPQEVGSPLLVGIAYVAYRDAWEAARSEPPTFFGMPFNEKFGDEAGGYADYYEFTVWLWRYNPMGMFAPANPLVNC